MDSLKPSRLCHFALNIYTEYLNPTIGTEQQDAPLSAAERAAQDLDVGAVMGRFVTTIPTLQTAVFSVQVPRDVLRTRKATLADGRIQFEEVRRTL